MYSALMGAISYPIIVHWVWNSGGWLAKLGYHDAGSSVVHNVGGWTALATDEIAYSRFFLRFQFVAVGASPDECDAYDTEAQLKYRRRQRSQKVRQQVH